MACYLGSDTKQPAGVTLNLATGTGTEPVNGMFVSGNFFDVLGVTPSRGRVFNDVERRFGGPPVILISDGLWQRTFGRDPAIIGREVRVDAVARTIIGVMPASFAFGARPVDYWIPKFSLVSTPEEFRQTRVPHYLGVVARLKPGVTLGQAQADLSRVASQLEREHPASNTQMGAGRRAVAGSGTSATCGARCSSFSALSHWCCSSPAPTSRRCCWRARPTARARWPCARPWAPADCVCCGSS